MAKLYFRYGTVGSAKTLNLLAVAHNYRQQGKKVLLFKPAVDTRFGAKRIRSRAGLEQDADRVLELETSLRQETFEGVSCILVDEAQFLSERLVEELREIATAQNIPVICYGLRTDFKGMLFDGSRRLLELADSIEEIKTTCAFCNRKGVMNLRHLDGQATLRGAVIELGTEERYFPACYQCYRSQLIEAEPDLQEQLF